MNDKKEQTTTLVMAKVWVIFWSLSNPTAHITPRIRTEIVF